ncbi:hypothetical protein [Hymenobacter coccineus]|uniref:Secretion system C-terminal sorting domain-containing protein n=1 Tax=Hymenobacter coccineus TaxID=1908235 RepID=A0A1G1TER4_9BACT|nr:hypothetical protein [Hymenobacter coccineus]OGX89359.1 hypothetical protein BEN49_09035 [Hymenobacter coccineus]
MKLAFYFRWLPALLLWLGTALAAQASHLLGAEMTYAPVAATTAGTPRYHVVLKLYVDLLPQSAKQPTATLVFSRNGCDAVGTGSFAVDVPITQITKTYGQSCPANLAYTVQLYETDADLPQGQWTISFSGENRAAGVRNITSPASQAFGIYCSAFLNTELVAQNTSPVFLSSRLPYVASGQAERYSFSAFDADGDSLVYRFVTPQTGTGAQYVCGVDIPSTPSPHFQLNAATGALTAPATATTDVGIYIMAARVDEYRRLNGSWQQIGWVMRDVSYLYLNATNRAPGFTGLTVGGGPAAQPLNELIRVRAGQTVVLALDAADPDAGQVLSFSSDAVGTIPGLALQPLGPTHAQLTWQVPATLPPGRYVATVAVTDDGCPTASEEQTLAFLVTAATPLATRPTGAAKAAAFPMPFREQVQFQAGAPGQAITIVDELGRVVAQLRTQADGRVVWQPAAALPAGLYVARGADGRPLARLLRAANTTY